MFLSLASDPHGRKPFLCLRRGVSVYLDSKKDVGGFSLPTQRCFCALSHPGSSGELFSAYAEVFLTVEAPLFQPLPFLCLRRGVSSTHRRKLMDKPLFSAYAEVFPYGRGGSSS